MLITSAGMRQTMLSLYQVHMPPDAHLLLAPVLSSGQIAGGEHVAEFEAGLGKYLGTRRITATGDASTSLAMCLAMAGVGPGDEVLASPMACLATNMPILNLSAAVRWCDIDPATGSLCADDLREQITPQCKAILVFHWAGNPADLNPIYQVARDHGLPVIEDATEALGAEYGGRKIGATGADFAVFSFYANKHITTIDGSAIAFSREADYERGRWLRRYGIHQPSFRDTDGEISPTSDIPVAGWNTAMNHVAATLGMAQMCSLPEVVGRHQENGRRYDEMLDGIPGIRLLKRPTEAASAHWVYTLLAEDRDRLLRLLRAKNVYASKVHLRNDIYSCFGQPTRGLPGVDYFQAHALSLPCGWWVESQELEYVVDAIRGGWQEA